MNSPLIERTAAAMLFWGRRRDAEAIRGAVAGLSDEERRAACDRLLSRELDPLTDDELVARMYELASKARGPERKITRLEHKQSAPVAVIDRAPPVTDTGWFEGIANTTGVRDRQGDMTAPGAFTQTVDDLNAGRVSWAITRQHSSDPADLVGYVTHARETAEGLWIRAAWTPDPVAQQVRQAVASGARYGLSITYLPRRARPAGQGGRLLDDIDVTSIAITIDPASAGSYIRGGKGVLGSAGPAPTSARVITVGQSIAEGAAHRDPERDRLRRQAKILAAASWPPPELVDALGIEAAYGLLESAARAKAARAVQTDPERARAQARHDRANADYNALARVMARLEREACGHPACPPGRCLYG